MGVVIKSKTDGFRRGGIAHRAKGTFYEDGELTEQQLAMMRDDPELLVVEGVQVGALQVEVGNDELLVELGNTVAALEHELEEVNADRRLAISRLEQASAGLEAARSEQQAARVYLAAVPNLVVDAALLLVPEAPVQEGFILIKAESLAALIAEHLPPQLQAPEAQDDANRSTLSNASGDESPNPAPVPPVASPDGAQAGAVAPDKGPAKRGKAAQKEAD